MTLLINSLNLKLSWQNTLEFSCCVIGFKELGLNHPCVAE